MFIKTSLFFLALYYWVVAVTAQTSQHCSYGRCLETHIDPLYGIKYGFALPVLPSTAYPNELIGQIDVPPMPSFTIKWAGIALGGSHNLAPLIVAWPNPTNTDIVFSTRQATNYNAPTPYVGPMITTLGKSFVTGGGWRWTFRCQNCLSWNNVGPGGPPGSINTGDVQVLGWAISTVAVWQPWNPASGFDMATDFRMWGHFMSQAQTASYSAYLTA